MVHVKKSGLKLNYLQLLFVYDYIIIHPPLHNAHRTLQYSSVNKYIAIRLSLSLSTARRRIMNDRPQLCKMHSDRPNTAVQVNSICVGQL